MVYRLSSPVRGLRSILSFKRPILANAFTIQAASADRIFYSCISVA